MREKNTMLSLRPFSTYNHVDAEYPKLAGKLESVTNEETGDRFYRTPDGKKYASVTTVLKEHTRHIIENWKKAVGEEQAQKISKRASNRGKKLHKFVEDYLDNKMIKLDDPEQILLFQAIEPHLKRIDNIHVQEKSLYSDHLRLAGTVDCIAEYDQKLSVIDIKTSSKVKTKNDIHSYFMQCAAYAVMWEELTGMPITNLVIIMAIDGGDSRVFRERRDNWIPQLLKYRDIHESKGAKKNVINIISEKSNTLHLPKKVLSEQGTNQ